MLARQSLLERAPAGTSPAALLGRIAGLQAQYAPTTYVGLWSRLEGFARGDLTSALEQRTVIQGTLQRGTLHVVAAEDYWPISIGVRQARREWYSRRPNADVAALGNAAERVRRTLEVDGVITRRQLDELSGRGLGSYVSLWLDLVRVPPSGTWDRRRADHFALAEQWVGAPPALTENDALDHLVRHYLTGFGPASVKEIAAFCAMAVEDVRPSAERVSSRRFAAEDGTELVDLDGLILPAEDAEAPVRYLGTWEALLLAHARRALVIREEDRPRIFGAKRPQSLPTFLVDGQVAGTWRITGERIETDPWVTLSTTQRRAVVAEAEALEAFHR